MTIIIILGVTAVLALAVFGLVYSIQSYSKPDESHLHISDKELLLLISEQRDGLLSIKNATSLTGLTKAQLKKRFYIFQMKAIVNIGYTNSFKYYYSLKQPITKGPFPLLSSDPFLTIADLMALFKHFDYRLSLQDLCISTGLPVNVIANEMKHFLKEKIVAELNHSSADGMSSSKFYILTDAYRDNPEKYIENQEAINLDLSKIYKEVKNNRSS